MLLLATSDDPDRRDTSDPEATNAETRSEQAMPEDPERSELPAEGTAADLPVEVPPPEPAEPEQPSDVEEEPEVVAQEDSPSEIPSPTETLTSTPLDVSQAPAQESGAAPQTPKTPPVSAEPEPPTRAEPPVHPPAATPQPSASDDGSKRSSLQRVVLAVLVIAAAALIGYVLSQPSGRDADADALVRSLDAAGRLQLRLETDTPAEARRYIREEFGWRVGVPVFEAIPLRGVAIAQTAPSVEVPVFLYVDSEDRNVAVFAYSYALLDQVPDRLRLTATDYDELDEGTPFVRRADGNDVVIWRDRDDIYVAVTDLPPDALLDGFAMAR